MATVQESCVPVVCKDRAEWLSVRRDMIGASESAAIFGVGYADQSPITVWESKVNDAPADLRADEKRLRIGLLMEPALRSILTDETGWQCESPGQHTIFRRTDLPWLGATLDAMVEHPEYGPIPCELKNVSAWLKADWDDEPPLKFQVQCQHQLAVTGAPAAVLFGLIGGNEPVVKLIPRNEKFIAAMLARLTEFWVYVERREMPPVDASEATAKALNRIWERDDGGTVYLDDLAETDKLLQDAKAQIKSFEAIKTACENKIKAAIGEATFGEIPGVCRYSWKSQTRAGYYVEETTYRTLRRGKG